MSMLLNLSMLGAEEREMLRRGWGTFVAMGVLFALLGVAGLVYAGLATLVTVIFVGWIFAVAGFAGVLHAVFRKGWSGFVLDLLAGLVTGIAGVFIILHPAEGASVLTAVVGVMFLVGGIFRLGAGVALRNPYAGWFVFHGIISLLLGLMILVEWPYTAVWVIGTLVSIDLLLDGLRLISFGLAVKSGVPAEPLAPPAA
ncbi:HdeD family acid-resistance protein [Gemmata sp.]|uniref:HdeD family acid-resistance protein n=1 Tax=Gemmata sp. TaxID=1914242 RepID=UPI003F72563E